MSGLLGYVVCRLGIRIYVDLLYEILDYKTCELGLLKRLFTYTGNGRRKLYFKGNEPNLKNNLGDRRKRRVC